jgi:hypothetical protein
MKPRNPACAESSHWTALVWLLIGPLPLILVLAYQAGKAPAGLETPKGNPAPSMMVPSPAKPAVPDQIRQAATKRETAKDQKAVRKRAANAGKSMTSWKLQRYRSSLSTTKLVRRGASKQ